MLAVATRIVEDIDWVYTCDCGNVCKWVLNDNDEYFVSGAIVIEPEFWNYEHQRKTTICSKCRCNIEPKYKEVRTQLNVSKKGEQNETK